MKNIAIFASGNGSNFENIVIASKNKIIDVNVSVLVCDKKNAYAVKRAENLGVKTFLFNSRDYNSKEEYEKIIAEELSNLNIELICLAGYMKIIGDVLLKKFENKIINIHPSLLPAFKGSPNAIFDAYNYGVKVYGASVHFVNKEVDGGKIIVQKAFEYIDGDDYSAIERKMHIVEHEIYIMAIKKVLAGGLI